MKFRDYVYFQICQDDQLPTYSYKVCEYFKEINEIKFRPNFTVGAPKTLAYSIEWPCQCEHVFTSKQQLTLPLPNISPPPNVPDQGCQAQKIYYSFLIQL